MLGILLIYFIGKRFYDLADEFNQNKWLYAILSIVIYYAATAVFGLIFGIMIVLFEWDIEVENNIAISLFAIPFGLLADWIFYLLLEKSWKKSLLIVKDDIEDIGKPIE